MLKFVESKDAVEIQSYMSTGRRSFFLLLALLPLLAPYELIYKPNWHNYLNGFFLFAAAISFGALAVSALLVWAAIAGLDSVLRFDRGAGTVTSTFGAPIVGWRTDQCPLKMVAIVRVDEHEWSDGAPSYSLMAQMTDGREFKTGSSWVKEDIEALVTSVSAFLGRPRRV
jgi:hypothetical protein